MYPARRNMASMTLSGRIRWRLALAIAAVAFVPLLVATVFARSMVRQSAERFYRPEVGVRLDQSLGLYQELAKTIKVAMRHAADAAANDPELRRAAAARDTDLVQSRLVALLEHYPGLVALSVEDADERSLAHADRGRPVDDATEKALELRRPLNADESLRLRAVFVTSRARLDELESMGQFIDTYRRIEGRRGQDERSYVLAFAALLGISVVLSAGAGLWLARGPTLRLVGLAEATRKVGAGDLTVRVPDQSRDEIGDLTRSFNRMVSEIETSRARIEYLQRIGAWQEMARRLAHEIKNPLTPIQLAVQEAHRRCPEEPVAFRRLMETTLQIVEDEVETLRRLVSEFSSFARMPQANLSVGDLGEFLRSQQRGFELLDEGEGTLGDDAEGGAGAVRVVLELEKGLLPAQFDAQLLRRVFINLIRNAVQARPARSSGRACVAIRVAQVDDWWLVDVDDDGAGIPEQLRASVFDPYVTTKANGTGLGLAIVKKIIVEHGGTISAEVSPEGGASMRIRLPIAGAGSASRLRLLTALAEAEPPSSRHIWGGPGDSGGALG